MGIEQVVLQNLRELSPEQQQELLTFMESLKQRKLGLSPQEKVAKWHRVIESLPEVSANLPDEALRREAIYETEA
jgi:transcriptional regulator with AAA-type ATPase domain